MQLDYRTQDTYQAAYSYEASREAPSSVPRRASAHPEAIAPVRHKYRNTDQMEMIDAPTRPVSGVRERVDRRQRRNRKVQLSRSLPFEEIDTLSPSMSGPRIAAASTRKRAIADRDIASIDTVPPRQHEPTPAFNMFDRARWWLLYPNRLEFLLWLVGTVLLIAVLVAVILIVLLSVGVR
jgi:hypothetical protein